MIFELYDSNNEVRLSETYFSIGGGFINTLVEISQLQAPLKMESSVVKVTLKLKMVVTPGPKNPFQTVS